MVEAVAVLKAEGKDLENHLALVLSTGGPVIIEMMPDMAPNHVARFKELTKGAISQPPGQESAQEPAGKKPAGPEMAAKKAAKPVAKKAVRTTSKKRKTKK